MYVFCSGLTYKTLDLESLFVVNRYIFSMAKFEYQGHRVKVKVTRAKKHEYLSCPRVVRLRLKGNFVHL